MRHMVLNGHKDCCTRVVEQYIQHNLKTDLLSKNLGVTLPELFQEWQRSQIEISDHVYIDPSYSNADVIGNLVKIVNGLK